MPRRSILITKAGPEIQKGTTALRRLNARTGAKTGVYTEVLRRTDATNHPIPPDATNHLMLPDPSNQPEKRGAKSSKVVVEAVYGAYSGVVVSL